MGVPDGRPVPLERVRELLDDERLRLRVGIVDACGGGSWTGTKGLEPEAVPFELPAVAEVGRVSCESRPSAEPAVCRGRGRGQWSWSCELTDVRRR